MKTIESINTTAELRIALDLHDVPAAKLHERFKEIADALLTKFAIQKGEQLFYITDIEFYYYTNDHKDFITYPRKCHAGEWFFHPSGVDIAFESAVEFDKETFKPILNSEAKFGGILIRSIIPANGATFEGDASKLIDHPLNISYFLFDHFDALYPDNRYPILVECPHSAKIQGPCSRYIKITDTDKKFDNILKYNYSSDTKEPQDLRDKFKEFLMKNLRYKSIQ